MKHISLKPLYLNIRKSHFFLFTASLLSTNTNVLGDSKAENLEVLKNNAQQIADESINLETDTPEVNIAPKLANDDKALSILATADDHRNHRLHFSLEASLAEAMRLYDSVISEHDVSPDLKARAKINIAKIYVVLLKNNINPELLQRSKEQILTYVNDILIDPVYSQDLKGWARRFQAKLYIKGLYTDNMNESSEKAYALLHENLDNEKISSETKARTRMQLAKGFLNKQFQTPNNKKPADLAKALYQDILEDPNASGDMKTKARMALVTYSELYMDMKPDEIQKQRLHIFQEALKEPKVSPIVLAQIKAQFATDYLLNAFAVTPIEAKDKALEIMTEVTEIDGLPDKQKLYYKTKLAENYLNCVFNTKPSESKAKAMHLFESIPQQVTMSPDQMHEYKMALAYYYVRNAFDLKKDVSTEKALTLYAKILDETSFTPKQKAATRWVLANLYASHMIATSTGEPSKAAADILRKIILDTNLTEEDRIGYKTNLRNLCANSAFGIEQTKMLIPLISDLIEG